MILKECKNCGALVKVEEDCHCKCGFVCCGETMSDVIPNSSDGAKEKHIPNYKVIGEKMEISVDHVMDTEHYIAWVSLEKDNIEIVHHLNKEKEEIIFPYIKGATLYSFCNKHGLWKRTVD